MTFLHAMAMLWSKFIYVFNLKFLRLIPTIFLLSFTLCYGQKVEHDKDATSPQNKGVDLVSTGLQIGEKIPDLFLKEIHNYKTPFANLSDFKGKLLILDFWATWCNPCISMIPLMDSIQRENEKEVQFLSITTQSTDEVLSFLDRFQKQKNKIFKLPHVTDDRQLHKLFPFKTLPHYVWINSEGIVIAITDYYAITRDNISKALLGELNITRKKDLVVDYDKNKPLLINGNGGDGNTLLYYSLISSFIDGIGGGLNIFLPEADGRRRIAARNISLIKLYNMAFSNIGYFGKNKIIFEVQDSSHLYYQHKEPEIDWYRENSYCYDLIVPAHLASEINEIMLNDLHRFFPKYRVSVEKRNRRYIAMIRTSKVDKLKSSGGKPSMKIDATGFTIENRWFWMFFDQISTVCFQNSPIPVIDETGYKERVDISLIAKLTDIESLNKALAKYDLKLIEKVGMIDVMVIKDHLK